MKKNLIFFGFFIVTILFLRLFAVWGTEGLSDDTSYDVLRQIDSIKQTGVPLFEDSLSYLGSSRVFNPVLYYLLVPFSYGDTPILHFQIVFQILFLFSISFLILIIQELGIKKRYAYIGASLWAVSPISTIVNLNSLSPIVLITPVILLWIYAYIRWVKNQKTHTFYFLFFVQLILITLHPIGLISLLGMLISLFYTKIDHRIIVRKEKEVLLFLFLFAIGIYYFLYYSAFLYHGFGFFFQQGITTPQLPLSTMIMLVSQLGLIIIPLAVYSLVLYAHHHSIVLRFSTRLLGSLCAIIFILFLIRSLSFQVMFYLITLFSIILVSILLQYVHDRLHKTKYETILYRSFMVLIFFVLVTFTISSFYYANGVISQAPSKQLLSALDVASQLNEDSIILTPMNLAYTTMYFSDKKTLVDKDSLLKSQISQRLDLLNDAYTSSFLTPVLNKLELYDINRENVYILFDTPNLPSYITTSCITLLTNESDVSLYWIGCET